MLRPIAIGLAGLEAAASVSSSPLRHASWWLEWHTRLAELQPCESS